jgi:hypothetical protein
MDPVFSADTDSICFSITGTDGIPIAIESTDDIAGGEWSVLGTNTIVGGMLGFVDEEAGDHPLRVYRVAAP